MEFLSTLWLGMPVWIWLAFIGTVLAILAFDLGIMNREAHEIGVPERLKVSALYIGLGLAWAGVVYGIYLTHSGTSSRPLASCSRCGRPAAPRRCR
jgi:tellurite resistance protein TerC